MMPGCPNPLLMAGASDPLDELGIIARSLRFRSAASAYLSKTPAAGNRSTYSFGMWVSGADLVNGMLLLTVGITAYDYDKILIANNGKFNATFFIGPNPGYQQWNMMTSRVFRDPAAMYHLHFRMDTPQAIDTNRMTLEINGVQETAFDSIVYPAQNAQGFINLNSLHRIMSFYANVFSPAYSDGAGAFIYFTDGTAPFAASFGVKHPLTKQWRPRSKSQIKAVVDAGGTNSFFLPFDDPTNLTTLCADASSKGNNWTANNISLTAGATYDSLLHTPTNVFPTLNTLSKSMASVQDGGFSATAGGAQQMVGSSMVLPTDKKVYAEFSMLSSTNAGVAFKCGFGNSAACVSTAVSGVGIYEWYASGGGNLLAGVTNLGSVTALLNTDIMQCAYDPATRNAWIGKNNVWYDSACGTTGNPATGANPTFTLPAGEDYFFICGGLSNTVYGNFGQRAWERTCPAGFGKICTKDNPRPAIPDATKALAVVKDTGANIQATLAAARASFGVNYIEVFKSLAAEGWRWRFSDDVANCLDSSSTAAKAAFPTLAGANYSAFALKVSPANGIATGRQVHVNGVADTITDGLGNVRKMIILKNEATGTWYVYHPDLTAGTLIYLEQTTGETADTSIGTVLSNSFVAAASLPSGTYRWAAFAEVPGFLKLSKHTGNGAAPDGSFDNLGLLPAFRLTKGRGAGTAWPVQDSASDPYNQLSSYFLLNNSSAVGVGYADDFVSNGIKFRNATADQNVNAANYVGLTIGQPFRYANAR